MDTLSTGKVAAYFNRSEATIRNWAKEFAKHLSPTGVPEAGKVREFTIEDMTILDLVATLKDQKRGYEDIHVALDAGQRGNPPDLDEKTLQLLQAT